MKIFKKKKTESIRVQNTSFAPLGSYMPHPSADTRTAVLNNVAYVEKELLRWGRSIAWVSDDLNPAGIFSSRPPILNGISRLVQDSNALAVTEELSKHLGAYDKWSCCIVRDLGTACAIQSEIAYSEARVADKLLPLANDNIEARAFLKDVSVSAKIEFGITSPKVDPNLSHPKAYWTPEDLAREKLENEQIYQRYAATEEGRKEEETPGAVAGEGA